MRGLAALALNSLREQLRSRFLPVSLMFAGVVLYISVLLGILAADQELRVLLDFGLSASELMAVGAVAYTAATGLLQEMETKTIYMILTRPVSRAAYLVGRYLGTVGAAAGAVAFMSAMHFALLFSKGWVFEPAYLLAFLGILLKLVVVAAAATLLALISTSVLSALTMTAILYMLGHFLTEIRFLIGQTGSGLLSWSLKAVAFVVPDLQMFNFRDRLHLSAAVLPHEAVWAALLYAPLYAAACLALTLYVFNRKEF